MLKRFGLFGDVIRWEREGSIDAWTIANVLNKLFLRNRCPPSMRLIERVRSQAKQSKFPIVWLLGGDLQVKANVVLSSDLLLTFLTGNCLMGGGGIA